MKWQTPLPVLAAMGALAAAVAAASPPSAASVPQDSELARQVRQEPASLPYDGVFDLLTFRVSEKGEVTLGGYAMPGPLAQEAERRQADRDRAGLTVSGVSGVSKVTNDLEVAPEK